jgi:hypothetical protein
MSSRATIADLTLTGQDRLGFVSYFNSAADVIDDDDFAIDLISSGTVAKTSLDGGAALVSGAATTDNSGANLQNSGCVVNLTAGKPIRCSLTAQLTETTSTNGATESDIWFGLFIVDASIIASAPNDTSFYFRKDEGDTNIDCVTKVGTATAVATLAVATMDSSKHTYDVVVTPNIGDATSAKVEFLIDGVKVHSESVTGLTASVDLAWSLAYQTGDNTGTKSIALFKALLDKEVVRA